MSKNAIILKNNQFPGKIPSIDELILGEIAINTADAKLYTKKNDGSVVTIGSSDSLVQSVAGRTGQVILTKSDVGLSNVDNTSDLDKPVSGPIQDILNTKALINHTHSNDEYNTFIGDNSLVSITASAERNTSIGYDVLSNLVSGFGNVALGSGSAYSLTTGSFNTSIGTFSQISSTVGSDNNSIGYSALLSNTTGVGNCALGNNSLLLNTTGVHNIGIGYDSLKNNTTGSFNIAIGLFSGTESESLQNCICLGTSAKAINSGELVFGSTTNPINTSATVGVAGTASILPGSPLGYLELRLNGSSVKIPYYRN